MNAPGKSGMLVRHQDVAVQLFEGLKLLRTNVNRELVAACVSGRQAGRRGGAPGTFAGWRGCARLRN